MVNTMLNSIIKFIKNPKVQLGLMVVLALALGACSPTQSKCGEIHYGLNNIAIWNGIIIGVVVLVAVGLCFIPGVAPAIASVVGVIGASGAGTGGLGVTIVSGITALAVGGGLGTLMVSPQFRGDRFILAILTPNGSESGESYDGKFIATFSTEAKDPWYPKIQGLNADDSNWGDGRAQAEADQIYREAVRIDDVNKLVEVLTKSDLKQNFFNEVIKKFDPERKAKYYLTSPCIVQLLQNLRGNSAEQFFDPTLDLDTQKILGEALESEPNQSKLLEENKKNRCDTISTTKNKNARIMFLVGVKKAIEKCNAQPLILTAWEGGKEMSDNMSIVASKCKIKLPEQAANSSGEAVRDAALTNLIKLRDLESKSSGSVTSQYNPNSGTSGSNGANGAGVVANPYAQYPGYPGMPNSADKYGSVGIGGALSTIPNLAGITAGSASNGGAISNNGDGAGSLSTGTGVPISGMKATAGDLGAAKLGGNLSNSPFVKTAPAPGTLSSNTGSTASHTAAGGSAPSGGSVNSGSSLGAVGSTSPDSKGAANSVRGLASDTMADAASNRAGAYGALGAPASGATSSGGSGSSFGSFGSSLGSSGGDSGSVAAIEMGLDPMEGDDLFKMISRGYLKRAPSMKR